METLNKYDKSDYLSFICVYVYFYIYICNINAFIKNMPFYLNIAVDWMEIKIGTIWCISSN